MKQTPKAKAKIERDEDGWWAYYEPGWKSATNPVGSLHSDHEDTKREINQAVKDAIPCDCQECKAVITQNAKKERAD